MRIILGSASPRRRELLTKIGFSYETFVPSVCESSVDKKTPLYYVKNVTLLKMNEVKKHFSKEDLILCADTIVVLKNKIYEKPESNEDAFSMLKALQNKTHSVITAFCISYLDKLILKTCKTKVTFDYISDENIKEYISRVNVLDYSGSYAIQSQIARHIKRISGNIDNVVGLPTNLVYNELVKLTH